MKRLEAVTLPERLANAMDTLRKDEDAFAIAEQVAKIFPGPNHLADFGEEIPHPGNGFDPAIDDAPGQPRGCRVEKTVRQHHGGIEGKESGVVSGQDDRARRGQVLDASAFDAKIVAVERQEEGKGVG